MRFWKIEDERRLKAGLKERLRSQPCSIQKAYRKEKKVRPSAWERVVGFGVFLLFSVLIPAGIFLLMFDKNPEFGSPAGFVYALSFWAWVLSLWMRSLSASTQEYFLAMFLPLSFEALFRLIRKRIWNHLFGIGCIGFILWCVVAPNDPSALPLFFSAGLHGLALVCMCLFFLKLGKDRAFKFALGILFLGLIRIYGLEVFPEWEPVLALCSKLFPNGWVQQSLASYQMGQPVMMCMWLALMIPAGWFGKGWFTTLKLECLNLYMKEDVSFFDPEDEWEDLENSQSQRDHKGSVGEILLRSMDPSIHPFIDFFIGDLGGSNREWKWTWVIATGMFCGSFIPHPFVMFPCLGILVIITITLLPLCGGAWFRKTEHTSLFQPIPPWALYPVDFEILAKGVRRVNTYRFVLALPFWLMTGNVFGRWSGDACRGFFISCFLWLCLLAMQSLAGLLSLTQLDVVVVKGKVRRWILSWAGVLLWILFLIAGIILSFFAFEDRSFLMMWCGVVVGGVFAWGWILHLYLTREACGNACDLLAVRR